MTDATQELVDQLLRLKVGLKNRDFSYCGKAAEWIIESVLVNLEKIDLNTDGPRILARARNFALGAIRFVADQDSFECEILLNHLNRVLECSETAGGDGAGGTQTTDLA
jgi:hypothetical protein